MVQKLGHPNIAHHLNLSPSLDSKVANWSRTAKIIVWTALNQVVQMNLDLRNCDLRKNLDLRVIVATLVHKLFDLRKIF